MKNLPFLLVLFFVIALNYSQSYSQISDNDSNKTKWGFGISSTFYQSISYDVYIGSSSSFSIPIFLSSNFKLEPFIGFYQQDYDRKVKENTDNIKYNRKEDNMVYGAGLFYCKSFGNTKIHIGGNIAYTVYNQEYENSDIFSMYERKIDGTGLILSPIIGGEYFISEYFSFGAEAHFEWSSRETDEKTKHSFNTEINEESTSSRFYTKGLLIFRFYPWSN